jgi:hypothetical protein
MSYALQTSVVVPSVVALSDGGKLMLLLRNHIESVARDLNHKTHWTGVKNAWQALFTAWFCRVFDGHVDGLLERRDLPNQALDSTLPATWSTMTSLSRL